MTIKEVYMNNFGKFQKKRISFQPGINIVYGENESGKTTLYTFLQGIFFGIPRKRGTASKTDTYTRCLPWENPSWYEGSVLFEEKKCLWKKEIWRYCWEEPPRGSMKILPP